MNNKQRGAFLKKARENKNLTQEELGDLIYYSDKTISAWEKGIYTPSSYDTIIKLSEVLDISPLSILYGEEDISDEKQVSSYLDYRKRIREQILIIIVLFLITILTIIISFYYTNIKETNNIYSLKSNNEHIIMGNSFYLQTKKTNFLSINKITTANNKYIIKRIELYTLNKNKRKMIMAGPNESYFLENNNVSNEYNIKDLETKDLYMSIYNEDNEEIVVPLFLDKKSELFNDEEVNNNKKLSKEEQVLLNLGFTYNDGQYTYQVNNITINYNLNGILKIIKENKDNNEYLSKRVTNNNTIYKKIYTNGKFKEKELIIKEKATCDLQHKNTITELVECLNYLSEQLQK